MAAHGYYMQSGRMAAVLVTAGAGITNALLVLSDHGRIVYGANP